ncbi:aspartate/glutamate racemase family protein [Metabacillus halosaccharovorans]|uniref:aspartate/glutamate racemase family protein n=1 Tax=Metabacillus halosaccharovorans TaxID=930124 RepID=UPI00203B691F|nr:aspartate/glutamate racemase family protein [Metabacillus halosaccharovorans]MCM3443512.1 aspartate/glutamate racemase family protein [Metabacillus halosaccharovorans]
MPTAVVISVRERVSLKNKIAIVHTTPVTIEPLKTLINETVPSCEIVNFVDDSILPELNENGGDVRKVEDRLIHYYKFAEQAGADVILNACSSVGGVVAAGQKLVGVPIVRIDEAMAEKAIQTGRKVGVIATLATTLGPTMTLLKAKSAELNREVELTSNLAEEAYRRLLSGDKEGHDQVLVDVLMNMAEKTDVVVLAQASMARVVSSLPEEMHYKFLSSPKLGVETVKEVLEGITK